MPQTSMPKGKWLIYSAPPNGKEELIDRAKTPEEAQKLAQAYRRAFGKDWTVRVQRPEMPIPKSTKKAAK